MNSVNSYLSKLCLEIKDRSVGSGGNREATKYFKFVLSSLGWDVESQQFDAYDWEDGGAQLIINNN